MRCPGCATQNRDGARFCDSCGIELVAPEAEREQAKPGPAALEPLPSDVPAEIADGRYRVRNFLGQGGRKRVFLAEDMPSGSEVAVALFDTENVAAAVQARARREAQAMRKLGDHPHVVRVIDTGVEGDNPFIV
ncbi:MAG: protein kinase family protein, partial [Solirubrobacterales bacterium]